MLHKEIIQGKINEARMGAKDLASVQIPQDATFGFEFEVAANKEDWDRTGPETLKFKARQRATDEIRPADVFDEMSVDQRREIFKEQQVEPRHGWVSHDEVGDSTFSENREKVREILQLPETTLEEKQEKLASILFYELLNVDLFQQSYEKLLGDAREYDARDGDRLDGRLEKEMTSITNEYHLDDEVPTDIFWMDKRHTNQESLEDLAYANITQYFTNWNHDLFDEMYVQPKIEEREAQILAGMSRRIDRKESEKNIIDHFAEELSGLASYVYHGSSKSYDEFVVEPDTSISPFGCEIVSPIYYSWEAAKNGLNQVLTLIRGENVFTNESTGLHCNIGGSFLKDVDWVKFLVFFGELDTLEKWGRSNNSFTRPYLYGLSMHFEDNTEAMMKNGRVVPDFDTTRKLASTNLVGSKEKHKSINFSKIEDGYVEMRVAGGADYEHKEKEIIQLIQRFLRAAAIAIDPNAYKEEFYKKLYKLWDGDKLLGSGDNDQNRLIKKIHKFLGKIGIDASRLSYTDFRFRGAIISTIILKNATKHFSNPKIRSEFRELFNQLERNNSRYTNEVISNIKEDQNCPKEIKEYFIQLLKKDL